MKSTDLVCTARDICMLSYFVFLLFFLVWHFHDKYCLHSVRAFVASIDTSPAGVPSPSVEIPHHGGTLTTGVLRDYMCLCTMSCEITAVLHQSYILIFLRLTAFWCSKTARDIHYQWSHSHWFVYMSSYMLILHCMYISWSTVYSSGPLSSVAARQQSPMPYTSTVPGIYMYKFSLML